MASPLGRERETCIQIHYCIFLQFYFTFPVSLSHLTMKNSQGTFKLCPSLKSLSSEVRVVPCCRSLPNNYKKLDTEVEKKLMEIKRNSPGTNSFRSIDSVIVRFPQFREGLKEIRGVFEKYDEDSNGSIDHEELKKCLYNLQFHVSDEEIDDLFYYCDIDENEGIQFNEFIVLLCLIYLHKDYLTSSDTPLKTELPKIDDIFNMMIEVFLFLDKSGDGKLKKKDVVEALNEACPWERSSSHITTTRFKKMYWDRNGKISFREFLFAFIKWVGIDSW